MKYAAILLLGLTGFAFVNCSAQTDIGSAGSAGAVTSDVSPGGLTPNQRLELQRQELKNDLLKLAKQPKGTSQGAAASTPLDRDQLLTAYTTLRTQGHDMSPFNFLATAVALQGQTAGQPTNKDALAVAEALDAVGVRNSEALAALAPEALSTPMRGEKRPLSKIQTAGSLAEDRKVTAAANPASPPEYKTVLKQVKKELAEALK